MINADVILGLVTCIISIFWIAMSLPLPGGTTDGVPGPGYFPIILSASMLILSFILMFNGFKNKKTYFNLKSWDKINILTALFTCIIIMFFLILWPHMPFIIVCALMLFILGLLFKLNLITNICLTLILTFFSYFVFNNVFHVILNL